MTLPLEELAGRLDTTMAGLEALDATTRQRVQDALDALGELHREALTTIVRRLREDERGRELLYALVDEPEVRMVLSLAGIIRPDPVTLAGQVLDRVRPTLQGHGGDVELVRLEAGVAFVRLLGACTGCSMAAVTMRESVEQALVSGVPGITAVEVVPTDPGPTFVPLSSLGVRTADTAELEAAGWCASVPAAEVPDGEVRAVTLQPADGPAVEAVLVRAAGALRAYVNACAHQGRRIDGALVDATEGTLTCPWHGLCYDASSGECLTLPGARLVPLPLRVVGNRVWVRPAGEA